MGLELVRVSHPGGDAPLSLAACLRHCGGLMKPKPQSSEISCWIYVHDLMLTASGGRQLAATWAPARITGYDTAMGTHVVQWGTSQENGLHEALWLAAEYVHLGPQPPAAGEAPVLLDAWRPESAPPPGRRDAALKPAVTAPTGASGAGQREESAASVSLERHMLTFVLTELMQSSQEWNRAFASGACRWCVACFSAESGQSFLLVHVDVLPGRHCTGRSTAAWHGPAASLSATKQFGGPGLLCQPSSRRSMRSQPSMLCQTRRQESSVRTASRDTLQQSARTAG